MTGPARTRPRDPARSGRPMNEAGSRPGRRWTTGARDPARDVEDVLALRGQGGGNTAEGGPLGKVCDAEHDRGVNAAVNLKREGIHVLRAGG